MPLVTASPSDTFLCVRDSVVLLGGGAISYQWSGGLQDGQPFAPILTGSYTVTGTDANGCQNCDSLVEDCFVVNTGLLGIAGLPVLVPPSVQTFSQAVVLNLLQPSGTPQNIVFLGDIRQDMTT